jgi:hypothetical protein
VAGSRIVVEGYREAVAAFRGMPRDVSNEIRLASGRIADTEAAAIRSAAGGNRQAGAAAQSLRVRKDRFPALVIGGARKVTATARAEDLLFGAEFGAAATTPGGFRPHRGTTGYFLFPTLRRDSTRMWAEWLEAAERVISAWEH